MLLVFAKENNSGYFSLAALTDPSYLSNYLSKANKAMGVSLLRPLFLKRIDDSGCTILVLQIKAFALLVAWCGIEKACIDAYIFRALKSLTHETALTPTVSGPGNSNQMRARGLPAPPPSSSLN